MDIEAIKGNEFLGLTGRLPRPSRETHGGKPELLAAAQKRWDAAAGWAEQNDRLRRERLAKLDADQEARREARRRRDDDRFVAGWKAKYLAADPAATDADFARDLPELRRQHRLAAALKDAPDDGRARADNASRYAGIM